MPRFSLKFLLSSALGRQCHCAGWKSRGESSLCFAIFALTLLNGCQHHGQRSSTQVEGTSFRLVTREGAEAIARREARKVYGNHFDVDNPVVEQTQYWHVVVESLGNAPGGAFTNGHSCW
jgi:hypothetical protein